MPTERLYYTDAYLTQFTAHVTAATEWDGQCGLALDRSAFYPEGGGQPADQGLIAGLPVLDVQVRAGEVWHRLDATVNAAPRPGDEVLCTVDWARRFDHMQQHLGQHLLTAAFVATAGLATTAFHLGVAAATIDLDTPALSAAQVQAAEDLANQIIWEDRPVQARFVAAAELATLPLRKPPSVEGPVRVVSVPDFDYSACGGTHPRSTGGVGLIAIQGWARQKSGVRVEFMCGGRALRDYRRINGIVSRAAAALSVGGDELEAAMARLRTANDTLRKELEQLRAQTLELEAQQLYAAAPQIGPARVVTQHFDGVGIERLRALATRIAAQPAAVALLIGSSAERVSLVVACADGLNLDARVVLQSGLALLGGRGGGSATLAQGGGAARADLAAVQAAMERHLHDQLS